MCCVRNPRNIDIFVQVHRPGGSGARPGGAVTGVTEKLFMSPNVYVPFPAPNFWGASGEVWGTPGLLLKSTVREVSSGEVARELWGEI